LPQAIDSTSGIVGGIIIGHAAVEAGLVSPMVVMIVSLTGICSYAVPNISLVSASRLVKYLMMLLRSIYGRSGSAVGVCMVLTHLCSLKSHGNAYVSPFNSQSFKSVLQDTVFRFPLDQMKESSDMEE
jgi:Bacillus/Clostridium GerA spore germination protein.